MGKEGFGNKKIKSENVCVYPVELSGGMSYTIPITKQKGIDRPMIKKFARYYRPYWKLFALDLFCALMIAAVDLLFPMVSRWAMQELLPKNAYAVFFTVIGALVAAYLVRAGFQYFVNYWGHVLGAYMESDMRRDLFRHLQKLPFRFYDKNRTGQLMSRVVNDLFEVVELAHHGPEDLFISLVTLVGAFIILLTIQWKLALVVFALVPLIVWFTARRRRKMSAASRQVKEQTAGINADIESSISGVRVAKAFNNETYEYEKFEKGNARYRNAKKGFYRQMGIFQSGMDFLTSIMNVAVIAFGGALIMSSQLDYIDLLTFTLYVGTFLQPIRRLSSFVEQYTVGMAGFGRFQDLLAVEPDISDAPGAAPLKDVRGDIRFEDVTFSYDEGVNVLAGVNLSIRAGQTVALVGPSGGGKSTLCHLIPRFYEPTAGRITIDGRDIRDDPPVPAGQRGHCAAGCDAVRGHHFGQHSLRPAGRHRRRGGGGGPAGGNPRGYPGHARRLSDLCGGAGDHAVRRTEAAGEHRPDLFEEPAGFDFGRGDIGAGHRDRGPYPGRVRQAGQGAHHADYCPPAVHHPARGRNRVYRQRGGAGNRHP